MLRGSCLQYGNPDQASAYPEYSSRCGMSPTTTIIFGSDIIEMRKWLQAAYSAAESLVYRPSHLGLSVRHYPPSKERKEAGSLPRRLPRAF